MNYDGVTIDWFATLNEIDRMLFWAMSPFVVLYIGLKVLT